MTVFGLMETSREILVAFRELKAFEFHCICEAFPWMCTDVIGITEGFVAINAHRIFISFKSLEDAAKSVHISWAVGSISP
jgi:hypothetical protein